MNDVSGPENLRYGGTVAAAHPAYILAMLRRVVNSLSPSREGRLSPNHLWDDHPLWASHHYFWRPFSDDPLSHSLRLDKHALE